MAEIGSRARTTVGLLGGGVIGSGWAARFLLHGIDVRLFDPDNDAARVVEETLERARRAFRKLIATPLPAEGTLTIASSVEDAVADTDHVQENAPEREELKRELIARADRATAPDTVIASSTSGLRPSSLQADMSRPQRLLVGHPFNPVYLLPLVEICGGRLTAPRAVERAAETYREIGMAPLVVRTEIDGFIADRLLEALWREALWLVRDDVATVEEIDDAIRLGAGLRWAFMGSFLTYRIAGGEPGMRHFLEQFGPSLAWPWSRLTDVPEPTEALVDKIVAQSDAQSDGRSIRELERLRDDCLVAIIRSLRTCGTGAGTVLEAHERRLSRAAAAGERPQAGTDPAAPLRLHDAHVEPEWMDYNGHAHESRYLQVFGDATDALLRHVGVDSSYAANGHSYYTVETHLSHLREAFSGDHLHVTTQVLGFDERRLHVFHALYRSTEPEPVATAEQMLVHVDTRLGRASPAPADVLARISRIAEAHGTAARPERAGRRIAMSS